MWYFTSRMRAVLSARSRNVPRREQVLLLHVARAEQHQVRGDAEDARHVLRALHLAAHPEDAIGYAGQHAGKEKSGTEKSGTDHVLTAEPVKQNVVCP